MNPEMKKKVMTIAAAVLCLTILGSGTLAYFTDSAMAHNVITSGGVDIELVEQTLVEGSYVEFPEEGVSGVMPGGEVSKKVTVKSTADSAPCWVRIRVSSEDLALMTLNIDTANWHQEGEYYYYRSILPTNGETQPLFTTVTFDETMDNDYQNETMHLTLVAEAVQSDNNVPESGNSWDAEGWKVEILPLVRQILN